MTYTVVMIQPIKSWNSLKRWLCL